MFNSSNKVMAINVGYYNCKIKNSSKECLIETRIQENDDAEKYIDIMGTRYEVGEGIRDLSFKTDSKVQDVVTKYAILSNCENGDIVTVVVALPMAVYLKKENREKYRNRILAIGNLSTLVGGKLKNVTIKEVIVYMEGAAAMLEHQKRYKGKAVGLIDIGGNTINCAIFRDGKIQKETITQLDLGMIKLERRIIDTLNSNHSLNIQDYEIKDVLTDVKFSTEVRKMQDSHIDLLKQRLLEKKWNVEFTELLATGGGSADLSQSLRDKFRNIFISDSPVYDNVRGMYLVGSALSKG